MEITDSKIDGILVLSLRGRLDANTSPVVQEKILAWIDRGEMRVLVDLAGLGYVSSAGLRVFMMAAKRLKASNGKMAVCFLTDSIQEIFEIANFTDFLPIYATRDEAMKSLAG